MARKTAEHTSVRQRILPVIGWMILAGAWVLAAAALVSYHPADPPSHYVWPLNDPPRNWVGGVGAYVAHQALVVFGPGAWVLLAGWLVALMVTARGNRIDQPLLRVAGVMLMAASVSAAGALPLFTGGEAPPEGGGGHFGLLLADHLLPRFGTIGTPVVIAMSLAVGAVLAADRLVMAAGRKLLEKATLLREIRPPRFGWLRWLNPVAPLLAWLHRSRKQAKAKYRLHDLDDHIAATVDTEGDGDEEEPVAGAATTGRGRRGRDGRSAAERVAMADDATTAPGGSGDEDAYEYEYEYEEDEEADGSEAAHEAATTYNESRKAFDADALRAKIRQMPINFAPRGKKASEPIRQPDFSGYKFPGLDTLEEPESNFTQEMERIVREQAVALESALSEFRIEGEVVGIDSGPVITLFEVRLAPGTKVNRIQAVASDVARALKAQNIRIVPNTAGKDTIGIEVPNLKKEKVRLKELMGADPENVRKMKLPMFLGKDASGNPLIQDLSAMPHMLIAGTTGSGKSVCMNSIIMSFMFTRRPDELKLVLVDPKMVEMSLFKDIPHLMCPVVTEMGKAASILEWAVGKMDERYELLMEAGVRDIAGYNSLEWEQLKERFEPATAEEEARIPRKLPYLVFVIDELADLMLTNKEVENHIVRIAQKARAVGIHLILATQRPQANVVTGLIKGNMPCRVSFKVASGLDSRIVLDQKGAELLLGQGDMLFLSPRSSKLFRAQGTLVDDIEIRRVVKFLKTVAEQSFEPQLVQIKGADEMAEGIEERDELFEDAVRIILESQRGSVSLLQRRLAIGYARASRLIEQMAQAGILGDYKGSQARECNITLAEWEELKAQAEAEAAVEVHGNTEPAANEAEQDSEEVAGLDDAEVEEEAGDEQEEDDEGEEEEEYEYEYEYDEDDGEYGEEECEDEEGDEEEEEEIPDGSRR